MPNPIEERIRLLAHQKWQDAGRILGDSTDLWLEAELEVVAQLSFLERLAYRARKWGRLDSVKACLNFFVIAIAGGALLWWIYRCTDWAETALGLFGLGAFVSFAALFLKLLPKDQAEALQEQVFGPILRSQFVVAVVPALLLLLFVFSTFLGSIEVEAGKGASDMRVWAYAPGATVRDADSTAIASNGRVRFPRFTPWHGRDYRIKVTGLPEKKIVLVPWLNSLGPQRLLAPADFLRPVVLIGAESSLIHIPTETNPLTLHVELKRKVGSKTETKPYKVDYYGRALWIGCNEGDVDLPKRLEKLWEEALEDSRTANVLLPPTNAAGLPDELEAGDVLTVDLIKPNRVICKAQTITIRMPTNTEDMVNVITLPFVRTQ